MYTHHSSRPPERTGRVFHGNYIYICIIKYEPFTHTDEHALTHTLTRTLNPATITYKITCKGSLVLTVVSRSPTISASTRFGFSPGRKSNKMKVGLGTCLSFEY